MAEEIGEIIDESQQDDLQEVVLELLLETASVAQLEQMRKERGDSFPFLKNKKLKKILTDLKSNMERFYSLEEGHNIELEQKVGDIIKGETESASSAIKRNYRELRDATAALLDKLDREYGINLGSDIAQQFEDWFLSQW